VQTPVSRGQFYLEQTQDSRDSRGVQIRRIVAVAAAAAAVVVAVAGTAGTDGEVSVAVGNGQVVAQGSETAQAVVTGSVGNRLAAAVPWRYRTHRDGKRGSEYSS